MNSSALCTAALLIWRTISFSLPLLIAGIVTAFYRTRGNHSVRFTDKEVYENRKTMTEMKRETLVDRQVELETMIHTAALTKEAIFRKVNSIHKKEEKFIDPLHQDDEVREIDIGDDDD